MSGPRRLFMMVGMTQRSNHIVPSSPPSPPRPHRVVAGLLLLSLVPVVASGVRVLGFVTTDVPGADEQRFFDQPVPIILHAVFASLFLVGGALQFPRGIRRRFPRAHRWAGYGLLPAGAIMAATGLWMTLRYPRVDLDGPWLDGARVLVAGATLVFLAQGGLTLARRRYLDHGAWMMRAYALGLGAGTQVFTSLPVFFVDAAHNQTGRFVSMAAGWAINLAVAEWVLFRRRAHTKPGRPRGWRPVPAG